MKEAVNTNSFVLSRHYDFPLGYHSFDETEDPSRKRRRLDDSSDSETEDVGVREFLTLPLHGIALYVDKETLEIKVTLPKPAQE